MNFGEKVDFWNSNPVYCSWLYSTELLNPNWTLWVFHLLSQIAPEKYFLFNFFQLLWENWPRMTIFLRNFWGITHFCTSKYNDFKKTSGTRPDFEAKGLVISKVIKFWAAEKLNISKKYKHQKSCLVPKIRPNPPGPQLTRQNVGPVRANYSGISVLFISYCYTLRSLLAHFRI